MQQAEKQNQDQLNLNQKKQNRPASPEQRAEIKNELINKDGQATETQIKSIKRGLKKLREKNEEYEPYIAKVAQKIMNGLTNTQANELLIEVGNKVEE